MVQIFIDTHYSRPEPWHDVRRELEAWRLSVPANTLASSSNEVQQSFSITRDVSSEKVRGIEIETLAAFHSTDDCYLSYLSARRIPIRAHALLSDGFAANRGLRRGTPQRGNSYSDLLASDTNLLIHVVGWELCAGYMSRTNNLAANRSSQRFVSAPQDGKAERT